MIYATWTHAFHLPGANTDQSSCDMFENKRELITEIIKVLEESREPIVNLGIDGTEDELNDLLDEFRKMAEDPETENEELDNKSWYVGDMEITIHRITDTPRRSRAEWATF